MGCDNASLQYCKVALAVVDHAPVHAIGELASVTAKRHLDRVTPPIGAMRELIALKARASRIKRERAQLEPASGRPATAILAPSAWISALPELSVMLAAESSPNAS